MKVLIIGLGSIAQKHIKSIRAIDTNTVIYALRSNISATDLEDVINVYNWDIANEVDFILISNPTNLHGNTILKALNYNKPLFIEKPVLHNLEGADKIKNLIHKKNTPTYIACVLRFHPVITFLKDQLSNGNKKIDEVNIYCGSYLPQWRPGRDYKKTYSALPELGGGVHLDLIHELDYMYWLFGKPEHIKSVTSNTSHLQLEVTDYAAYICSYSEFNVNITLNYFRKKPKRTIEIVREDSIIEGNLLTWSIQEELSDKILFQSQPDIQALYDAQMLGFFDVIKKRGFFENDFATGVEVLKLALE